MVTVNSTAAMPVAMKLDRMQSGEKVISQALTFVAICNVIHYCRAIPVFLDVDVETMGMSSKSLKDFLIIKQKEVMVGYLVSYLVDE